MDANGKRIKLATENTELTEILQNTSDFPLSSLWPLWQKMKIPIQLNY